MTKETEERFYIFYASWIVISAETETYKVRHYEDDKMSISLKRSIIPDDTVVIYIKGADSKEIRVYEVALCPPPFSQRDTDQVYLKGHWEEYLTKSLLKKAEQKLKSRHKNVDDFFEFIYDYGPEDDSDTFPVRVDQINDEELFNNLAQA